MFRVAAAVAVLTVFPTALAAAAPHAAATSVPLAKTVACDVTSSTRAATFYGRMESIPGAAKLQMRFLLLERLGRLDDWDRLDVPALRMWHASQPGVKRFGWKQTVSSLRLGGAYKARVQYRWLAANGTVLGSQTRDTPVCRGTLANIAVRELTVKPGPTADTVTYRAAVENTGKVDADGVDVLLSVDKAILDTVTISSLEAGEVRTVSFTGPPCKRAARVTVDPDNSIGESDEGDNSQLFPCP